MFLASLGAFAFLGLLTSLLIPETMGRSLEDLAGEEHVDHEGKGSPSWHERLWSRLTNRQCPKEDFDEEDKSESSVFPKFNSPTVFLDQESIRTGIPDTTNNRDNAAEAEFSGPVDKRHNRRFYEDEIDLTPARS